MNTLTSAQTAYLLLAQDADINRLIALLGKQDGIAIEPGNRGELSFVRMQSYGKGVEAARIIAGANGYYVRLSLPLDQKLAIQVAELAPVRALRLVLIGESAKNVATYSWWGPDPVPEGSRISRESPHRGLSIRATYLEAHIADPAASHILASPRGGGALMAQLTADVVPFKGVILSSDQIAGILESIEHTIDSGAPGVVSIEGLLSSIQLPKANFDSGWPN